jgi:hypothetical protein
MPLAGHGDINLASSNTTFDNIYFHHGINCPGDTSINITDSVVYEDLTCEVTNGNFWVRLENVDVRGILTRAPASSGTQMEI